MLLERNIRQDLDTYRAVRRLQTRAGFLCWLKYALLFIAGWLFAWRAGVLALRYGLDVPRSTLTPSLHKLYRLRVYLESVETTQDAVFDFTTAADS